MPRQPRLVVPTIPHHITQRGNYKQTVFEEHRDFNLYCKWLDEYARKYNLEILAYCLMPNHVHFIAIPGLMNSLARTFNNAHMRYSQYLNKKRGQTGHVWQSRFYSCLLSPTHLYRAIRYVENNPVRARIVKRPEEYIWSSARFHLNRDRNSLVHLADPTEIKGMIGEIESWEQYLNEDDSKMVEEIREKTKRGYPVGPDIFVKKVERKFKRSFVCLKPGRPTKKSVKKKGAVPILRHGISQKIH